MTFLPIVERELRVATRRWVTWLSRCAAAGVSICFVFYILWDHDQADAWVGKRLFESVSWATLLACLLAGVLATADCISREKRDGTLGLLFLTPLTTWDVVLGKLAAASLNLFYGLAAVMPMLMLSLLYGGVTPGEVARMTLLLLLALALAVCLGMFASALWEKEKDAFGTAISLVVVFMGIVPALEALLRDTRPYATATFLLGFASLTTAMFEHVWDAAYQVAPSSFWLSCAVSAIWCLVALFLAGWLTARASRQDRPERWAKFRAFWLWVKFGGPARRLRLRQRWLGQRPFHWFYLRERTSVWFAWLPVAIALLFVGAAIIKVPFTREWVSDPSSILLTAWCLNMVVKFQLTSEAAGSFAEPRRTGALGLLVTTGMTSDELLRGRWRALARQFLPPLVALLVLEIGGFIGAYNTSAWYSRRDSEIVGIFAILLIVLLADLVFLPWLAMWIGLKTKSSSRATFSTVFRMLLLPGFLAMLMARGAGALVACYLLFGLIAAMQGLFAYGHLHNYFAVLACNPHLAKMHDVWLENDLSLGAQKARQIIEHMEDDRQKPAG